MAQALRVIAGLAGQHPDTLDWAGLRSQHTQAIRATLSETRPPAGVNKILIWLTASANEPGPLFWPADGRGHRSSTDA